MSIDLNITFRADDRLLDTLEYMGGWFQALYLELQKHPVIAPAKTEPAEKPPQPAPSALPKSDASKIIHETKNEAPTTNPPAPVETVEKPVENLDAKIVGDDLVRVRKAVADFGLSDPTGEKGNRDKLAAWLDEHGLKRIPELTGKLAAELLAYIQNEMDKGKEVKSDA